MTLIGVERRRENEVEAHRIKFLSLQHAVEKDESGHPQRIKLHVVNESKKRDLKQWAKKNLQAGTAVISDGLLCFREIQEAGYEHKVCTVDNGRDPQKTASFN